MARSEEIAASTTPRIGFAPLFQDGGGKNS